LARVLGRASYSFYLLHTLIINYISIPYLLPRSEYRAACVALTFVITWGLSILLFALYEEPMNVWIRDRFRSRTKSAERARLA
jgi:peptidoglycan/LPS O-acetylase OafA/YrhL